MSARQRGKASTACRKQKCWSQAGGTSKRRRGGRHSVKDKVYTAVEKECMQSEKGAQSSEITFSPAK